MKYQVRQKETMTDRPVSKLLDTYEEAKVLFEKLTSEWREKFAGSIFENDHGYYICTNHLY